MIDEKDLDIVEASLRDSDALERDRTARLELIRLARLGLWAEKLMRPEKIGSPQPCGACDLGLVMAPEQKADKWLRENNWDYEKWGDRRGDRSAYDTRMNYEISGELELAYLAGYRQAIADAAQKCGRCGGTRPKEEVKDG